MLKKFISTFLFLTVLTSAFACAPRRANANMGITSDELTPNTSDEMTDTSDQTTPESTPSSQQPIEVDDEDGEFAFLGVDEKQAILDIRKEARNKYYPLSYFNLMYDYYGKYGDCHVFFAGGEFYYQEMITGQTKCRIINVDGIEFKYYSSANFTIFAYKDGKSLELSEAFEEGWLTRDNIRKISELHSEKHWTGGNQGHRVSGDMPNGQFSYPADAEPGSLDDEAMNNFITHFNLRSSFDTNNIIHCGNYNGVAVFMYAMDLYDPTSYEGPNGETFYYKSNFKLILFKDNHAHHSIYPVQLGGFLDADDVAVVAEFISSINK